MGCQRQAPRRFTPGNETRCPLYRRLGGPQGRSRRVRKISSPPGFDPRTVQPVASHYTDCAIPAHIFKRYHSHIIWHYKHKFAFISFVAQEARGGSRTQFTPHRTEQELGAEDITGSQTRALTITLDSGERL